MKPLLLVVEDNPDVLYNLKLTLEFNDYEVITAENGLLAIEVLSKLEDPPALILSDIMMPKMNGYDFFKAVSENALWSLIPFIFLTARTSPKDVRFGKMLGVDDYIIKPFKEEDLLASIAGKIARNRKSSSINKKIGDLFSTFQIDTLPSLSNHEKSSIVLVYVEWDDKNGPTTRAHYPEDPNLLVSVQNIGFQLFNGVASIYGQSKIHEAQGILLNIENIRQQGYIYFDSIPDTNSRGRELPFMLGLIAHKINYFESLRIRAIFQEVTPHIKTREPWEIKDCWSKVSDVLTTPVL